MPTRSFLTVTTLTSMIAQGLDVNLRDTHGNTLLHTVCMDPDKTEVINVLMENGADPNALCVHDVFAPLHIASSLSLCIENVKALLKHGADPNVLSKGGQTPLHRAARFCKGPEMVRALLEGGADPNVQKKRDGFTPLHVAAHYNKCPEVIDALIEYGADPNATCTLFGSTPLHVAARYNKAVTITKALLDGGCDPKLHDREGWTPYQWSVEVGAKRVCKALENV